MLPTPPPTTHHALNNRPTRWVMGVFAWLLLAAGGLDAALAQTVGTTSTMAPVSSTSLAPDNQTAEAEPSEGTSHHWRYTLGLKLKSSDLADHGTELALRPVLGLRYGRWRLGHATGDDWLAFSGYRKEANLAYQLRDNERLQVSLSLRIQNLKDNSSFDGFSSGQNTLRGRVGVNYRLNRRWSIGTDLTQDLLGRGDGTTLSLGASYGLPLSERSSLSMNGGFGWATGNHWATQMRRLPTPQEGWRAGLGSVGFGLSYRYALTPQWAWFGTAGTSRHLGQVADIRPSQLSWNGQIGILYFSR